MRLKGVLVFCAVAAICGGRPAFGQVTTVDLGGLGAFSCDEPGAPCNFVLDIDLAAELGFASGTPMSFTGIGWDLTISTVGASWLSEAVISFQNPPGTEFVSLTAGAGDSFPGAMFYSSGGIVDLVGAIGFAPALPDGMLRLEFYESFDDVAGAIDAFYIDPSILTLEGESIVPPFLGPDVLCPGAQDAVYELENPDPDATYLWTIDNAIATIDGDDIGTMVTVDAAAVCDDSFTLTVVCTDKNGDVTQTSRTILVRNVEDPSFDTPPVDMTVECDGTGNAGDIAAFIGQNVVATDTCDDEVTISVGACGLQLSCFGLPDDCEVTCCFVTWTAMDDCGNVTTVGRTLSIIDTTAPQINCPEDLVVSCEDGPPPPDIGSVLATDLCPGDVAVEHVGDVVSNAGCPRTITRTYRATDGCDNMAECVQTILVDRLHPGWNWIDNGIELTANQPTWWSSATGLPAGVVPFPALDFGDPPGRPAMDGTDDRVLRGYVLAWAVDNEAREIRWNHLKGEGTLINYRDQKAWEYSTYNYAHVDPAITHGSLSTTPGVLHLDGAEYAQSFDQLLLNFQAANSTAWSENGVMVMSDSDLTLHPVPVDLRQNNDGPITTKASFLIWNENEIKFSNTHRCITCWDQQLVSRYDNINSFLRSFLQTDHGKAQIDGHAADICNVLDDPDTPEDESVTSIEAPLLGVATRHLGIDGPPAALGNGSYAAAGSNLWGFGYDATATVQYDLQDLPGEAGFPSSGASILDWLEREFGIDVTSDGSDVAAGDPPAASSSGPISDLRVSTTTKGSFIVFPKVEIRWDRDGNLVQDTILSLTNDYPDNVRIKLYFINGDAPGEVIPAGF